MSILSPPDHVIDDLPRSVSYSHTVFEFRYGSKTRRILDPHSQLKFIHGKLPDSITVDNGERLVVFLEPKAVIASLRDSVDVQADSVHYRGWMGIFSPETEFIVDSDGMVWDANELE
ncbi:MAG: hypothetical protein O3C21_02415 [Verrucomicrobia bacterium]|nr:hypothetical protein [Verrucomicrobiota bacterium]